jgi:hypothetical protein
LISFSSSTRGISWRFCGANAAFAKYVQGTHIVAILPFCEKNLPFLMIVPGLDDHTKLPVSSWGAADRRISRIRRNQRYAVLKNMTSLSRFLPSNGQS